MRTPRPAPARLLVLGALAAGLALGAGCGDDGDDDVAGTTVPVESTTTAPADEATTTTEATEPTEPDDDPESTGDVWVVELSGAGEVPGPGDPAGRATLELALDPSGEVCTTGEITGLDAITGAFLGSGTDDEPTSEADTQIDLGITTAGGDTQTVDVCTEADPTDVEDLLSELEEDPGDHFVSLATDGHPDGAVRGQIAAA